MVSSMDWYRAGSLAAEWRRQACSNLRARQEIATSRGPDPKAQGQAARDGPRSQAEADSSGLTASERAQVSMAGASLAEA